MPNIFKRYKQEQYESINYGIESERITLKTDDSLKLAAWRTYADNPKGTIIILSGMGNPSVTAFFGYAKFFADNGWDSLLVEMRARCLSEGKIIGLGMMEWIDVKAGVDYLSNDERVKELPIITLGTSMGGASAIIAAGEITRINAVISLSAFSSVSSMIADGMTNFGLPKIISIIDKPFILAYIGFRLGFNKLKYSAVNGIAKLGERPILLIHSTDDTQVSYSEYEKLLKAAKIKNINITTFVRKGDFHFVIYDEHFDNPAKDIEFCEIILKFLMNIE